MTIPIEIHTGESTLVETEYPLGRAVQLWGEFDPALYRLTVELAAVTGADRHADKNTTVFGMREISTKGTQFVLNGRPIYLRGTLECAIFPLTGYPPTDVDSWKRVIRTCQRHGLNHIRFHSHCPPKLHLSPRMNWDSIFMSNVLRGRIKVPALATANRLINGSTTKPPGSSANMATTRHSC